MRTTNALSLFVILAALGACVPKGKYDDALSRAEQARVTHEKQAAEAARTIAARDAAIAQLDADVKALQARFDAQEKQLADEKQGAQALQRQLDASTAENAQLRKELERLGKNADKLLQEKGTLSSALNEAKARLEELRKAQAAADARAALFHDLALKLQKMIDAGQLQIVLRDGRMVIRLANDVLFDTAKTDIKPAGAGALKQIAGVLKTLNDRRFQIAGHTDNVPIKTPRFPSNWELSTARAVEVVHLLVKEGMRAEVLSAAGYGEFDAVSPNTDDASRQKNRRIEITLQPNIDELVAVPAAK
ncbi:MAG: OmpA family protein [Labilithrix sp.]|nr:OmpA family protein [Labilithrix sp.]MCW5810745.1 OmpA family protein [Labilithrix sp.]